MADDVDKSAWSGGALRPAGTSRASSKNTCDSRKLVLDQFEHLQRFLGRAGGKRVGANLRRVVFGFAQRAERRPLSCSNQRRTSGGATRSCSRENVKLVIIGPLSSAFDRAAWYAEKYEWALTQINQAAPAPAKTRA